MPDRGRFAPLLCCPPGSLPPLAATMCALCDLLPLSRRCVHLPDHSPVRVIYGPSDLTACRSPPLRKSRACRRASCACPPVPFSIVIQTLLNRLDQCPLNTIHRTPRSLTSSTGSLSTPDPLPHCTGSLSSSRSSAKPPARSRSSPIHPRSAHPMPQPRPRKFDPVDPHFLTIVQAIHEHVHHMSRQDRQDFACCLRLEIVDVVVGVGAIVQKDGAAPRKA